MSVKGEKRVRTSEMGAGKVYGEKIERKRNRAGEETKGGGSKERMGGGMDLENGERRGRWKKEQTIRMGERVKLKRRD